MPDRAVSVDRRTDILECACRVIARDGVDGLRMAAVAREAGVSSALLHYYFATRQELVRQTFEYHELRETDRSVERLAAIADPILRIRDLLAHELSDDEAVREGWILWGEMERMAVFNPALRASVVDRASRWWGSVAELVAAAQDAGRVDPEIDAASAALRLTCVVDAIGIHVLLGTVRRTMALRELDAALRDILRLGR